jgi:hypothetical protein
VVVEHVTVAAGGQAIVGAVMPGGGGRVNDQRCTPCTPARVAEEREPVRRLDDSSALRGDDASSHRVPVSGHAEPTTLSVTRRQEYGTKNTRRA